MTTIKKDPALGGPKGTTKVHRRRTKVNQNYRKRNKLFFGRIRYTNLLTSVILPFLGIAYLFHNKLPIIPTNTLTLWFGFIYFHFTMLAFTSGYHKYFTHRTFKIRSTVLYFYFAIFGASIGIGPIRWWAGLNRAHHRFTDDADRDPYSIKRGFLWAQFGWLLKKPKTNFFDEFILQEFPMEFVENAENEVLTETPNNGDLKEELRDFDLDVKGSDDIDNSLEYDLWLLKWQETHYIKLFFISTIILPTLFTKYFCDDSLINGLIYPGLLRLFLCQVCLLTTESVCHSKKIVSSIPSQPFNDKNSSINCNNPLFSLITYGQAHDNFHHEFPHDYRGSSSITSYDPTKWFLAILARFGIIYNLCKTPKNLIIQLKIQQLQHVLNKMRSQLNWGTPISSLPLLTPKDFKRIIGNSSNKDRIYIIIDNIIHDITPFMDQHPGGVPLLRASHGKDASKAFYGGVYGHLTAAINLLATMRIGVIDTGNNEDVWQKQVNEEGEVVENDQRGKAYQTAEAA